MIPPIAADGFMYSDPSQMVKNLQYKCRHIFLKQVVVLQHTEVLGLHGDNTSDLYVRFENTSGNTYLPRRDATF